MRLLAFSAAVVLLSGCTSAAVTNTASPQYVSIPAELSATAAAVTEIEAAPANATVLGPVRALACQRLTSDPLPTPEYAAALLKQEAAAKGANAVTNVSISQVSTASISGNCWANITARGTALKLPN